ncbi:hypothetical protein [Mesorhizobium sp. M0244]|uniref:hypothetical protein n=1 Tax=Mesorhizobium sp. M0244 TaxID=2956926 RepID=UPI00333E1484
MSDRISWVENTEVTLIRIELYSVVIEALSLDTGDRVSIDINSDFKVYFSGELSKYDVVKHHGSLPILWNLIGMSIVSVKFDQNALEIELNDGVRISVELKVGKLEQVSFRRTKPDTLEHLP